MKRPVKNKQIVSSSSVSIKNKRESSAVFYGRKEKYKERKRKHSIRTCN